jgi:hypothetical protein
METIIEEGIWDIKQKLPLRRVVFTCDGKKITRNLFILGDSENRNSKVDIIDLEKVEIEISLTKINKLSTTEIGEYLKKKAEVFEPITCFERNISNEIPFFTSPIITKNNITYND